MPTANITNAFIRKARCPGGRTKLELEFFDTKQAGFMLEARATGGKTFYQRYTDDHGRKKQYRIGPADILPLDQAREKGRGILAQVHLGEDPQAKRQEKRQILTLSELIAQHYLPHAHRTKWSWKTDESLLRIHVQPALGAKPIDTITGEQVAAVIHRMAKKGYAVGTRNRALIVIRYMFNLAQRWKLPGSERNPAAELDILPTQHRDRYLSQDEVRALLQAIEADDNQVAAKAVLLLLLTGARRNEVTQAKWEYVDWQRGTLFVPVSKSGKPRHITLNRPALALLENLPRLPANPYIFPSPVNGRPSAQLHHPWIRIRKRAGLENFRLHDLRHSFASFLVNQGTSLYVVQHLLGHSQVQTTQRYAHLAPETMSNAAELAGEVLLPASQAAVIEP